MKFQTVILSALLLVSSSAAQVAQQNPNTAQVTPTINKDELIGKILNRIKAKLDTYDVNKLTKVANKPARGPKAQKQPQQAPVNPPQQQVQQKRGILKTVWNVGKGLLGL